ncbi:MAG: hypothetical protein IPF43_09475 [Arcobacter sp.]|nr:hypothetical protein [Arcobacter sp.]
MKGKILDYNIQESTGIISGDDGRRYRWCNIVIGKQVKEEENLQNFKEEEECSKSIYCTK